MAMRYPIYVPSKGRAERCITSRVLCNMGIEHYVIVEEQEFDAYRKNLGDLATPLVLPKHYLDDYDTCDDLGDTKSKGPGPARNFAFDHSLFHDKHWVMDDNFEWFYRLNRNEIYKMVTSKGLEAAEDFVDRYSNVPIAGLNYEKFCKSTDPVPPFYLNTRVYSCLLLDNSFKYRWRARYNEDTDLCLRVLKDGFCTIQFNAFLCGKVTTQRMRGGNSKEFYDEEGTKPKSQMLEDLHPDVAKVTWKFNRWHHQVNYKPFKKNRLILREEKPVPTGINEYGMELVIV